LVLFLSSFSGGGGGSGNLAPNPQTVFLKIFSSISQPSNTLPTDWLSQTAISQARNRLNSSVRGIDGNDGFVTKEYWDDANQFQNFIYMTGGFPGATSAITFCVDHDNLSNVASQDASRRSISVPNIDVSLGGIVWWQAMTQCNAKSNPSWEGNGAWWKFEKTFSLGDYEVTVPLSGSPSLAQFVYQGVTNCSTNFNTEFGCGSTDRK
jgi:hypothetical protein